MADRYLVFMAELLAWGWACSSALPAAARGSSAMAGPPGVLAAHGDIGDPARAGSAAYDSETQSYTVSGAGSNMWFDRDQFHFVYRRIKGDFILRARARFVGAGVEAHRKLGWMVRDTLDTASAHISAVVHGDGLTALQFRREAGAMTEEVRSELSGAEVIQLERRGGRTTVSVARFGQPFEVSRCEAIQLPDAVFVGLFVCSHNSDVMETAVFDNVRVTVPAAADFVPYRDYIGSRLETLDVDTGERRVLYETRDGIEAPNWTPDGKALLYNSRGRLYRFNLADRTPAPVDTGFATNCNNDHVVAPDGKTLGISHHAKAVGGGSLIYTVPIGGGTPRRITDQAPSYLHGWSPDGAFLLFTGQRGGDFDIYRIPIDGGGETRLTTAVGLDDGPEYSPDGQWIYFNSARTGTMQVWRMKPDGSGQQCLTHDAFNDWFPHVSPDGRRIVFLSFPQDIPAEDHPFYQQVTLRRMPADGGTPRIIAYLYGGQGSLNVPSWSPDGRQVAFVSHSDLPTAP